MTPCGRKGLKCLSILSLSLLVQSSISPMFAQDYYQPDCLAAISDLDAARAVIASNQCGTSTVKEQKAISEINTAMAELTQLAKANGETEQAERLFPNFDPTERYNEALDLLDKAHLAVYQRNSSGPLNEIMAHIDTAIGVITSQNS